MKIILNKQLSLQVNCTDEGFYVFLSKTNIL